MVYSKCQITYAITQDNESKVAYWPHTTRRENILSVFYMDYQKEEGEDEDGEIV